MGLIDLSPAQLERLYDGALKSDFPPQELKPLNAMLALMEQGRYQALGLDDAGTLLGYALLWLEPGVPFALLDYLGTLDGRRGHGLGAAMLDLLADRYRNFRGIFGEAETDQG